MKKKIFALLALVCMTLTASADVVPTYALTKATDAEAHGTITFKVGENTVTSAAEGQTVTVAIEPNEGWSVGGLQGLWYAAEGSAKAPKRVQAGVDLLKDFELEPVEGNPNAFTFVMKRANAEISVSYVVDQNAPYKETLQTAIAIASNINPEALAGAIAAAQAAMTAEDATAESLTQANQTLEAAIKTYFGEVLPNLGAIVTALNEETLNTAYADADAALAKEDVTLQELVAAMQNIITAAQAVAPEHLQNLKGYAEKYGAEDAASLITLVDNALAAIEAGNVAQIIATMTAVKEAATPLATSILTQMIEKAQSYTGFEEDITEAQAALESGNYITMITAAKALYAKLQAVITGVGSMKAAFEKDVWYDLNGHKLNGKPTKKGVYFINGKKVVI